MVRGRSGHGKSNLALGISHALGYSPTAGHGPQSPGTGRAKWGARVAHGHRPPTSRSSAARSSSSSSVARTSPAARSRRTSARAQGHRPGAGPARRAHVPPAAHLRPLLVDGRRGEEGVPDEAARPGQVRARGRGAEKDFPGPCEGTEEAKPPSPSPGAGGPPHRPGLPAPGRGRGCRRAANEKLLDATSASTTTAQAKIEEFKRTTARTRRRCIRPRSRTCGRSRRSSRPRRRRARRSPTSRSPRGEPPPGSARQGERPAEEAPDRGQGSGSTIEAQREAPSSRSCGVSADRCPPKPLLRPACRRTSTGSNTSPRRHLPDLHAGVARRCGQGAADLCFVRARSRSTRSPSSS
jgi:hypothetical protein